MRRHAEPLQQAETLAERSTLLALLSPLLTDRDTPFVEATDLFFEVWSGHGRTLLKRPGLRQIACSPVHAIAVFAAV